MVSGEVENKQMVSRSQQLELRELRGRSGVMWANKGVYGRR